LDPAFGIARRPEFGQRKHVLSQRRKNFFDRRTYPQNGQVQYRAVVLSPLVYIQILGYLWNVP
jgi:hypothetical protein